LSDHCARPPPFGAAVFFRMAAADKEKAAPPPDTKYVDKPLPHEANGFTCSALGKQAQSQRETIPTIKISRCGRAQTDAVYISEKHTRTAKIGRESPIGGPIYDNKSSLGGCSFSFGGAKRDITTLKKTNANRNRPGEFFLPQQEDKDDMPTNDALDANPDANRFKYTRDAASIMGTCPRGQLKEAFLLESHPVAFFAHDSPGPAAIGGEFGPNYKFAMKSIAPARQFGRKTHHKGTNWMAFGSNPEEIGPGRHERKDVSVGQQHLTQRINQPVNKFGQAPKFLKTKSQDTISNLDAAKSCLGKQALAKNRSEPSINFSADNRDTRSKSMLCMTPLDRGPTSSMPKFVARQPQLPMERHVMRSGFG